MIRHLMVMSGNLEVTRGLACKGAHVVLAVRRYELQRRLSAAGAGLLAPAARRL